MAIKRQCAGAGLIIVKPWRSHGVRHGKAATLEALLGATMKPLLHLKTAILLAYVAACTHLVLDLMQADPALHTAPATHVFNE